MGSGVSGKSERSKQLDTDLEKERREQKKIIKLLLLGAGESGKSTVLKQMRILHKDGFSSEELERQASVIHSNIIQAMGAILKAQIEFKISFENSEREGDSMLVLRILEENLETQPISQKLSAAIKRLWTDAGVKSVFERGSEFHLTDSTEYFMADIDRICAQDYKPTEQDMLRARVCTTSIVEVDFILKAIKFRLFDVGGQRSQRRKWIHLFDDVNAIIYVASMSDYDQNLVEDETTVTYITSLIYNNRTVESLRIFKSICNNRWFSETSLILFLNKKDIFRRKIRRRPLTIAFPDYSGHHDHKSCGKYLTQNYEEQNENPSRKIFSHKTCATDTEQIQFVLNSCIEIIVAENLKQNGLA